jgi:hypothetical protein
MHARLLAKSSKKLQADAFRFAGIESIPPITSMIVRRTSLPDQIFIMDLKPGEISSVLLDPNGYVIYRLSLKNTIPLDQAREEIKSTLRSQHMQDGIHRILDSKAPTLDESYFARQVPVIFLSLFQ